MSVEDRRLKLVGDMIDEMERDNSGKKSSSDNYDDDDLSLGNGESSGFIKRYTDKQMKKEKDQIDSEKAEHLAEVGIQQPTEE
jgi:hypothetical protein